MARLLHRLGRTAYRRWYAFIAAWLVALVAVGFTATAISKPMSDAFSIPGIPSEKAADLQEQLFPGAGDALDQAGITVVVAAPEGRTLSERRYADRVTSLVADLAETPQAPAAETILDPVTAATALEQQVVDGAVQAGGDEAQARENLSAVSPLSDDGRIGTITYALDVDKITDVEPATVEAIKEAVADANDGGLTAEVNGAGLVPAAEGGSAELIGIGVAVVVLLIVFGSVVAAGIPIITALFGLGAGLLGVIGSTAFFDVGSSTPMLASMIGLAVGIDYALFILARYRSELEHNDDRADAMGIATGTAGSAVVFAGLTVLIALAALSVVGIPFLTSMGLAAAGTVFMAVLVALTLLPAVVGMLKSKAFGGRVRRYRPKRDDEGRILNAGVRWARVVGRAPVAVVMLVVVGLGALAVPVTGLHLAFPTDSTASSETTQRRAADLVAEGFGPGRQGPLMVVVDAREVAADDRGAAFGAVAAWAADHDGVRNAQVVGTNEDGTGAQVMVTPTTGADDVATEDLLHELRDGQSAVEAETGTTMGVTGITAIQADVSEKLADALPVYLTVVIGLAFLLLVLVFRSILVPLTATLGFLLSVLATLGATVLVFQEGLFGIFEGAPIISFMPIFLIGLVFGLAMDYQVFLVTRIREAYVHGASTREAVVDGFRSSARVVAAAAVIMMSVFSAFMLTDEPIIKSMGFALAVAVFFDAFIVRMALVPALLYLMGEKAWWLPRWLDRLLPVIDVEGESLERHTSAHAEEKAPQPVG
jgi:RND superfamily putative drug exporter